MAEFILKDRNGKDRTFNKETIYVQGTDGELKSFTHGAGNPVIHPLSITENGTYTAPANVDGYNPIVVEVPSEEPVLQDKTITENGSYSADAGFDGLGTVTVNIPDPTKTVILEEQEFNGFSLNETYGYAKIISPPPFVLVKGETYYVVWDGETYETTAQSAPAFGSGALCLGNGVPVGASGNGEPFVIGYMASAVAFSAYTDNRESHTVGIYQKVTQEIKLQDKTVTENGEYSADAGFDGLGEVTVAVEAKLQDKTITENGEYTADSGFDGLGKVTVDVAGSGGGTITPLKASGSFRPTSSQGVTTITHNLGMVPDYVEITTSATASNSNLTVFAYGFRTDVPVAETYQKVAFAGSNGGAAYIGYLYGIDTKDSYAAQFGFFNNANETTVKLGGSNLRLDTSKEYKWNAIRFLP